MDTCNHTDPLNTRILISSEGFARIEKEGHLSPLSATLRVEVEDSLNHYVIWSRRDRNILPTKEEKAHRALMQKHVKGLLLALDHTSRKFNGSPNFDSRIALSDQGLFCSAGVLPMQLCAELQRMEKQLAIEPEAPKGKGGRPADLHLPQLFCDLEKIYTSAGGRVTGVTKKQVGNDHVRFCLFVHFVNAALRSAPEGVGPRTWEGVAKAWERQWRHRRAFEKQAQSEERI
jgi:hypothetical protein